MTVREKKERLAAIVEKLKEIYPDAECALLWGKQDPWRLLVMGRLSAQCTDARVNLTSVGLFEKYPDASAMAEADPAELEALVRPCGLYRRKAADLRLASERYLKVYGGRLPDTMEELLSFPGVGRKIANLLLGDIFGYPAVVTDTHCIRICGRLGMYPEKEKNPLKVERILISLIDPAESSDFCHRIVQFGRDFCRAQSPRCDVCPLGAAKLCQRKEKKK
jgi:endonuclease-3